MIQERSKQILSGTQANTVVHGDCIEVMRRLRSRSVDFVLTDPPYLAHYCSRDGRREITAPHKDELKFIFERGLASTDIWMIMV